MTTETENPSLVGIAMRDLARLKQLTGIIAKHGFGPVLMKTPLGKRLYRQEALPEEAAELRNDTPAVRFTKLLGSLGPTYIKLGQILSMRRDIFPPDYIEALETLQDQAPPLDFATVKLQVEKGLGAPISEVFKEFDALPLATASIAQTHLATTLDGERVVVKVQRPGIESVMRSDLDILYFGAQVLEASIDEMRLLGVVGIIEEFERGLLKELNFQAELSNLLEMQKNLDPERKVTVPRPHPELSSRTVLTMQYFVGKPIRKLVPHAPETKLAVEKIVHSCAKQALIDGFFHGDPHSGNILINDEGLLCMIDLGMVGRLSEEQRDDFVTLMLATITNDSTTIARVLLKIGTPTQRVNINELKAEIERIRSQYLVVGRLGDVDAQGFVEEFAKAAQKFRIKLATELTILIKAAATIEGIVRALDPEVDLVGIFKPYLETIMARRYSPERLLSQLVGEASGIGTLLRTLPGQVDQLFHDFETGNIQIRAVTPELDDIPRMMHHSASRNALALFAASMTLATAIVLPDHASQWVKVVIAVVSGISATVSWLVLLGWHWVGRGKPVRVTPLLRFLRR